MAMIINEFMVCMYFMLTTADSNGDITWKK